MKNILKSAILVLALLSIGACSKAQEEIKKEEVIQIDSLQIADTTQLVQDSVVSSSSNPDKW